MKPVNQRVREHRQRMKETMGEDMFKEMERQRIQNIRKKQKRQRLENKEDEEEYRKKERVRKRFYRARNKESQGTELSILKRNQAIGEKKRKRNSDLLKKECESFKLKVRLTYNENRRLKRQSNNLNCTSEPTSELTPALNPDTLVLKRRALQRLALSNPPRNVKTRLRLDKVEGRLKAKENIRSHLHAKVINFMNQDLNSVVVPDEKK